MKKFIYRKDKIIEICTNKKVLHLGFVQHAHLYKKKIKEGDWLHKMIASTANHIVGIDYLEKEVKAIREEYGYECYYADVTQLDSLPDLNEKFDVIVCGELIEHLENPGLMLKFCKKFMHPKTQLIITTPNPWSKTRINLIKKGVLEEKWLNKEHTCWFSFQTLKQLLERECFQEVNYGYYVGECEQFTPKYRYSLLEFIRRLKYKLILHLTSIHLQDGLFFVASTSEEK
ncbi:MAG: hypothetical protein DRR19_18175 [Candidatus Parabeggiatoa sp. nov. 1]|nr:MAG: hypothetical protein DRR19_18175 [Gammaproteobacteria bacterium]